MTDIEMMNGVIERINRTRRPDQQLEYIPPVHEQPTLIGQTLAPLIHALVDRIDKLEHAVGFEDN